MKIRHVALIAALASGSGMVLAHGTQGASAHSMPGHYASSPQQSTSGQQVRDVQQTLKQQGFNPGVPDGVMGPRTQQALRSFQQAHGLTATGNLDQQTLSALGVQGTGGMTSNAGSTPGPNSGSSMTSTPENASSSRSTTGSSTTSAPDLSSSTDSNANTGTASMQGRPDTLPPTGGNALNPGPTSAPSGSSYSGSSNPNGATQPSTGSSSSSSSSGMTPQSTQ